MASGPEVAIYTLGPRSNAFTYRVTGFHPGKRRTSKRAFEHDITAASHLKWGRPEWMYLILEQGKDGQALVQSLVSIDCLLAPAGLRYEDEDGWQEIRVGADTVARLRILKADGYDWLATNWREVVDTEVLEEVPGSEQKMVAHLLAPGHVFVLVSPREDMELHSVQRLTQNVCEVWKVVSKFKRQPSTTSSATTSFATTSSGTAKHRPGKLRPVKKIKPSSARKAAGRSRDLIDEDELQLELQQEEVKLTVEAPVDAAARPTMGIADNLVHTSWFPPLSLSASPPPSASPLPSPFLSAEPASSYFQLSLAVVDRHNQDLDHGKVPAQLPSPHSRSRSISAYSA